MADIIDIELSDQAGLIDITFDDQPEMSLELLNAVRGAKGDKGDVGNTGAA